MKTGRNVSSVVLVVLFVDLVLCGIVFADIQTWEPHEIKILSKQGADKKFRVYWKPEGESGQNRVPKGHKRVQEVWIWPEESLEFYWTKDGERLKNYKPYFKQNKHAELYKICYMYLPPDCPCNDIGQNDYEAGHGTDPNFLARSIRLYSLDPNTLKLKPIKALKNAHSMVPVIKPVLSGVVERIHSAVDMGKYVEHNPDGFADPNWHTGYNISDFGITIVQGQVQGLEGIYWATTPFIYDPDSPAGFVPSGGSSTLLDSEAYQAAYGDIMISSVITRELEGDLTNDGRVDLQDFQLLAEHWLDGVEDGEEVLWFACWESKTQCRGDANDDGTVGLTDWAILRTSVGSSLGGNNYEPCADFDRDGDVDEEDVEIYTRNFMTGPVPDDCATTP